MLRCFIHSIEEFFSFYLHFIWISSRVEWGKKAHFCGFGLVLNSSLFLKYLLNYLDLSRLF